MRQRDKRTDCWGYPRARENTAVAFQKLRRLECANENGLVECSSCDCEPIRWDCCDAGHYFSRSINSTLLLPFNVHPQCVHCNQYSNKSNPGYSEFMLRTYGEKRVADLRRLSNMSRQYLVEELLLLRDYYLERIKAELKRIGEA